jgi:hypothetical protein
LIGSKTSLCYTLAHHLPVPFQARRLHLHSACSSQASLILPTASSSFRTRWEIQTPANGDWCALLSPTALPFPRHACKMGNSSWNSIPSITPMFGSTHPTSNIGCSITPSATLPHQPLSQQHISFDLPILRKCTPHTIDLCLFVVASTCFIAALSFMDPLNSRVSTDAKCVTEFPLPTGTSSRNFPHSTKTPFLGSIHLHTLSTLIVASIQHFGIKTMPMHYVPLPIAATIVFTPDDKRSLGKINDCSPHFFF